MLTGRVAVAPEVHGRAAAAEMKAAAFVDARRREEEEERRVKGLQSIQYAKAFGMKHSSFMRGSHLRRGSGDSRRQGSACAKHRNRTATGRGCCASCSLRAAVEGQVVGVGEGEVMLNMNDQRQWLARQGEATLA